MPIYEYRCRHCRTEFEKIVFRQPEAVICPDCQSDETERLLSTFAVAGQGTKSASEEAGPCPCGAPRRGMCAEN